jgi:hypothetical protein
MTKIRIFANKHSFILVKFEKFTFSVQKQEKDKSITKKTIPLPAFDDAKHLEEYVVMMLKHQFKL